MASTGWKEWKKTNMTVDGAYENHDSVGIADVNGAFRKVVESTTDLVTFHARGGRMLFANGAARELMGIGPDDALPRVEMNEFFEHHARAPGRDARNRSSTSGAGRASSTCAGSTSGYQRLLS